MSTSGNGSVSFLTLLDTVARGSKLIFWINVGSLINLLLWRRNMWFPPTTAILWYFGQPWAMRRRWKFKEKVAPKKLPPRDTERHLPPGGHNRHRRCHLLKQLQVHKQHLTNTNNKTNTHNKTNTNNKTNNKANYKTNNKANYKTNCSKRGTDLPNRPNSTTAHGNCSPNAEVGLWHDRWHSGGNFNTISYFCFLFIFIKVFFPFLINNFLPGGCGSDCSDSHRHGSSHQKEHHHGFIFICLPSQSICSKSLLRLVRPKEELIPNFFMDTFLNFFMLHVM